VRFLPPLRMISEGAEKARRATICSGFACAKRGADVAWPTVHHAARGPAARGGAYQMFTRLSAGRTIGLLPEILNAFANSGRFESGPSTR